MGGVFFRGCVRLDIALMAVGRKGLFCKVSVDEM
jgi:hypothetical protein